MEKREGFTTVAVNLKKSHADRFRRIAEMNGENASSVLRKCVSSYIRQEETHYGKRSGLNIAVPSDDVQELMMTIVATGKYNFNPNELVDEIILNWFRSECRFHDDIAPLAERFRK